MRWKAIAPAAAFAACMATAANGAGLVKMWATEPVFKVPESICFDGEREILYVSNIAGKSNEKDGVGFISRLALDGTVRKLEWVTGLDAPKGMAVRGGSLFVSNIDELVEIDIRTDSIARRYPAGGAQFLNDVAVDAEGNVYVSDSSKENSAIYRLAGDTLEVWASGKAISSPNGLMVDGGRLIIGNSGDAMLKAIDLKTGEVSDLYTVGSGIDGLAKDRKGNFIVSDWAGRTSLIEPSGAITVLLDTRAEKINAADLDFVPGEDLVIIPTFHDNRVVAAKLRY
ncbi:MAG: SMP-30/gluconolactonase/LRE family protein [Candidatus Krumholzibacteria bacterium]|nr:SMP-30/gluconolactonase/LRE family protein [Candidatus Krumholzibacteria bacterium]